VTVSIETSLLELDELTFSRRDQHFHLLVNRLESFVLDQRIQEVIDCARY
jgi:hypothetical protein